MRAFILSCLFFFTCYAYRSPGNRIKAHQADVLLAHCACAIIAVFNPLDGGFYGAQEFCVSLQQFQVYMNFIVIAGLIDKIAVPRVFHIFPMRFLGCVDDSVSFLLKSGLKPFEILLVH